MRSARLVALTLLFVLVFAGHVLFIGKLAGETERGLLTGTVTDSSGATIPYATVSVKDDRTGEEQSVSATDRGFYSFAGLPPSSYTVTTIVAGLAPSTRLGITIASGRMRRLDLVLQPSTLEPQQLPATGASSGLIVRFGGI